LNKFLIQTVNGKVVHDFSFALIGAIEYQNWFANKEVWTYELSDVPIYHHVVPIGSVEFVTRFFDYRGIPITPRNIPESLLKYANRDIIYGTKKEAKLKLEEHSEIFLKSHNRIKGFCDIVSKKSQIPAPRYNGASPYEEDIYLISEVIEIKSEWRAFIFNNKLVGLQNYGGDFTIFPEVDRIKSMMEDFKGAPIAYTLDVGVNRDTFIIEVHDFFSCGLYGFDNKTILPQMFKAWYNNAIQ